MGQLREIDTRSVIIGDRARKDLGDLTGLAQSIARVGLLHPIVINRDGELIAGRRRMAAWEQLGRTLIKAYVVDGLDDALARLLAERDENTERLDMCPSEKLALGQRLEALSRIKAKDAIRDAQERGRQTRWGSKDATVNESSDDEHGPGSAGPGPRRHTEVRDLVGQSLGMSGSTYNQLRRVARAAEEGDVTAQEAMKNIDATGKIRGFSDRWAAAKAEREDPEGAAARAAKRRRREELLERQKVNAESSQAVTRKHSGTKSLRTAERQLQVIEQASFALAGLADGLSGVLPLSGDIDRESVATWHDSMRRSLAKIGKFLRDMET